MGNAVAQGKTHTVSLPPARGSAAGDGAVLARSEDIWVAISAVGDDIGVAAFAMGENIWVTTLAEDGDIWVAVLAGG